jgi:hypothetical protein
MHLMVRIVEILACRLSLTLSILLSFHPRSEPSSLRESLEFY